MENSRLKIHTAARPGARVGEKAPDRPATKPPARRKALLTAGERLIRNTAIAGAVFLCVLAVRNAGQPWSSTAMNGLRQAMTMRVDWDESIGRLSFVRALMPDAALVSLDLSRGKALLSPAGGEVSHAFSPEQPWLEYAVSPGAPAVAVADGVVTAAAQGMGGDWIVLLRTDGGAEAVYGYLAEARVQAGQRVEAGDELGTAARAQEARLYFELREDGGAVDPAPRFR